MKCLLYFLILSILFSCNQGGKPSDNTISKVPKIKKIEQEYEIVKSSTEIYFDSFAYDFIQKVAFIDSNDILIESLIEFKDEWINFIPKKEIWNDEKNTIFGPRAIATYEKKDSSFVNKQIKNATNMYWSVYRLQYPATLNKYYKWIEENPNFNWDIFKTSGFGCFVSLSAPIFNEAKNKAVITIGQQCHGTVGAGFVYFFKLQKDGKWEKISSKGWTSSAKLNDINDLYK